LTRPPPAARQLLPDARLPLLYFGSAYCYLGTAFLAIAVDPRAVAGFFYHSRMLAVVHLVTLGWISNSIVGALYIVAPLALRTPLRARRLDYWAFGFAELGVAGMASHFWLGEFSGMAWSALMAVAGFGYVGVRTFRAISRAPIQRAVRLHVQLALLNFALAATYGVTLGFNKADPFLPGFALSHVFAHAHLAGVGWAAMMVVGISYRLLPMLLPSAMPPERRLYASAVLMEVGLLSLAALLVLRSRWVVAAAFLIACGFVAYLSQIVWMRAHRKPAPVRLTRPDYGTLHAMLALCCLAVTIAIGVALTGFDLSELSLRGALAYGVFGLVGFLGQIVIGIESRLLPLFAWYRIYSRHPDAPPSFSPYELPNRTWQAVTFWLWNAGVPVLALGLFQDEAALVGAAAVLLLGAAVLSGANSVQIVRRAQTRGRARSL